MTVLAPTEWPTVAAPVSWDLDTVERGGGVAWAQRGPAGTRLRVADQPPPAVPAQAGDVRWHSVTEATLQDDGDVVVRSHCSPPALLVGRCGARLVPAVAGGEETAHLDEGDVLLLCSAGVLDAEPTGLGQVLSWSPRRLALHEPHALLEQLMGDVRRGAAAVVRCTAGTARHEPAHDPHEEDR